MLLLVAAVLTACTGGSDSSANTPSAGTVVPTTTSSPSRLSKTLVAKLLTEEARTLLASDDAPGALESIDQAMATESSEESLLVRADVLAALGRSREALEVYDDMIERDSTLALQARRARGLLRATEGRSAEAIGDLEAWLEVAPQDEQIQKALAAAESERG